MTENEAVAIAEEETPESPVVDLDVVESSCRVDLEAFTGPLDLLLYLVRKAEVDIADIPILAIADQFVATVASWEDADLEQAGDFILMAATLLEIKARLIAPPREDAEGDEEAEPLDPRATLIEQLMAFREVKEQVQILEFLETDRLKLHGRAWLERIPEDPEAAAAIDLENADAFQLFAAWDRLAKIIAGHGPRTVQFNDIPIEERRREIIARMRELKEEDLQGLLLAVPETVHRVGVVIAVLDCIRSRHLRATQYEQYGRVKLAFVEDIERNRPLEMEEGEPPLPEEMGPKGKRGRPKPVLRTFDGLTEVGEELEAIPGETYQIESDEDRFVRELNASTGIDAILKRIASLDELVKEHLVEQGLADPDEELEEIEPGEVPAADEGEDALEGDDDGEGAQPGDEAGTEVDEEWCEDEDDLDDDDDDDGYDDDDEDESDDEDDEILDDAEE